MKAKLPSGTSIAQIYRFFSKRPAKRLLYFTGICWYLTGICWYSTNGQVKGTEILKHFGKTSNIKSANIIDSLNIPEGGLKIGDTIPEAVWYLPLQVVNHPEGKDKITLNDYRGKLIILDFWATWCGSCIAAMPKMHTLQEQFGDSVAILASTYEASGKAEIFLSSNKTVKNLKMISLVNNSIFNEIFPHRIIPHYVWITASGKLEAATAPSQVTKEKISFLLTNNATTVRMKEDVDTRIPLFLNQEKLLNNNLLHYSLFFKGRYDGLPIGNVDHIGPDGHIIGKTLTNMPILSLYQCLMVPLFKEQGEQYSSNRTILEVRDTSAIVNSRSQSRAVNDNNQMTFSYRLPDNSRDSLYHYMLADLNRYTNYTGRIEKRSVNCLVMKEIGIRSGLTEGQAADGANQAHDIRKFDSSSDLVNFLNGLRFLTYTILDETAHARNVSLRIPETIEYATIVKELERQGYTLIKAVRTLTMFVLSDKDNQEPVHHMLTLAR